MRKPIQTFAFLSAALCVSSFGLASTSVAAPKNQQTGCHTEALNQLERLAPEGHAVYKAMSDKKLFLVWLTCDDVQLGLATSVHESVHVLTEERDSFPLINGQSVKRPHEVAKFFAPKLAGKNFDSRDSYVQTYIKAGSASSAENFLYMLDELNAYSHDLNSAVKLKSLQRRDRQVDHRDGLTALMAFVTSYTNMARSSQPATWQGLQNDNTKQVIQTLWTQAETVVNASCGIPGIGRKDKDYLTFVKDEKNNGGIAHLLGRAPQISDECLSPSVTSSTKNST